MGENTQVRNSVYRLSGLSKHLNTEQVSKIKIDAPSRTGDDSRQEEEKNKDYNWDYLQNWIELGIKNWTLMTLN